MLSPSSCVLFGARCSCFWQPFWPRQKRDHFAMLLCTFSGLGEGAPPTISRRKGGHCDCDVCFVFLCLVVGVDIFCFSALRLWCSVCVSVSCGGCGSPLCPCLAVVVVLVFLSVLWWLWVSLVSLSCGCGVLFDSLCLVVEVGPSCVSVLRLWCLCFSLSCGGMCPSCFPVLRLCCCFC